MAKIVQFSLSYSRNLVALYLKKIPQIVQSLYPNYTWRMSSGEKKIYLTFDDGPTPKLTRYILDTLAAYGTKATFFCLGKQVEKHNELYAEIKSGGHTIGSHGYAHLNGWKTTEEDYYTDIEKAGNLISTNLFRPPFGRIKKKQAAHILNQYQIIMWDVMPGDFDHKVDADECYKNIVDYTQDGSLIVLHDNTKSEQTVRIILPRILAYYTEKGYNFCGLDTSESPRGGDSFVKSR